MSSPNLLSGAIRPILVRMSVPMMLGIVSLMLFNLADIYFVSQLGAVPMAALAFTFPVTFSVISLAIGFGIGTSATLARLIGSEKTEEAAILATDNILMTFISVAVISLIAQLLMTPLFSLMGATTDHLHYISNYMSTWWFGAIFVVTNMVANSSLRARGDTKTPAIIMAMSSGLNFILDYVFIFGWGPIPALGIQGAALASVVAWALMFCVVVYTLYYRYRLLVPISFDVSRILQHWFKVLQIGLPAALSNMMTPIAAGILTALVATHGADSVAAFGVGSRLESLSLLACLALSMTLPPFISQNYGAMQIERVKRAYRGSVQFALIWQLAIFALLWLFQTPIINAFAKSHEVRESLSLWLVIVPLGFGMQAVIFLSASTFNALHEPIKAMRISIMRLFVFYVPLAWLANAWLGLQGMFLAFVIANCITAAIAYRWVNRTIAEKVT